jgi:hypothetical protein
VDGGLPALECLPNLDGVITADELPVALEQAVDYLVTSPATVDIGGQFGDDGVRVWSFTAESAADREVTFAAAPLGAQWYADSFPGGEIVVANDVDGTIESIYRKDESALWLLGLASREENPGAGKTLIRYQSPVALFRFPLASGDRYTEVGDVVAGTLNGLAYTGTDTYEIEVDGSGRLELPYVQFTQAHRVRVHVTAAPAAGGVTTSRRQVSFLFECFGEVARATSKPDESNPDFTDAAELRRFALSRRKP